MMIKIPGSTHELEAIFIMPEQPAKKVVGIICHPNPKQGGTMHNKVVTTLAKAYELFNLPTVRFNFYQEGQTAEADLQAVIAWVQNTLPDFQIDLLGFSFGSFIAAQAANQLASTRVLVSIAPPIAWYPFQTFTHIACPWWMIHGDQDEVVSVEPVLTFAKEPPAPLTLEILPGVGHFFHGQLLVLRQRLMNWLEQQA